MDNYKNFREKDEIVREERKDVYSRKRDAISVKCKSCTMRSYERCDACIVGQRLRWLETEYSDVTGFSHDAWKNV